MSSELTNNPNNVANNQETLLFNVKAGEMAQHEFAVYEALRYYTWADKALCQSVDGNGQPKRDPEWLANFRLSYGQVLMHMGKNDATLAQFELGLRVSKEAGLVLQQGKILRALGELSWSRSDYKEALNFCQDALQLLTQAGDIGEQCRLFGIIGNAYFSQGLFDQAVEAYSKKLKLARQIGDLPGEGEALRQLGLVMGVHGQAEKALNYLYEALMIARYKADRESERQVRLFIGNIHFEQGQLEKATEYYKQSLALARATGKRRGEGRVAINLGEICRKQGDLEGAQSYFNEAYAIAGEIQDHEAEGTTLSNLGLVHKDLGELDQALECFQHALSIFREINYRSNVEVEALSGIANILLQQGKAVEAKSYFEMAIASGQELGLWSMVVPLLRSLAGCDRTLEQRTTARARFSEALSALDNMKATNKLSDREHQGCLRVKAELTQEIAALEV